MTLKFSVPILEVALVLSLFFAVPMASVTLDVTLMMRSRGHRHLPLGKMIEMAVTPRGGGDLLKRDHAVRVKREVLEAISSFETPEFLSSDPHDPMNETSALRDATGDR